MNALPGRATLGRAVTLLGSVADQRTADLRVMADVDTASDLRDAATHFHAALSQAEFNVEPPVDLTLLTQAAAGLAAVDLDAYQRRIGDRVAGVAGRLDSCHMDDTGVLDGLFANEITDTPYPGYDTTTGTMITPNRGGFVLTVRTNRTADQPGAFGDYPYSEAGLRQMRALIDRALGARI